MDLDTFVKTGIAEGWVRETDNVSDIHIDGQNVTKRVYEVRVDRLRYNEQNARVATFMSRYLAEHDGRLPEGLEAVNDAIEQMIVADGKEALAKTKFDIKVKGQQEPAIILSNGIVIDGNRRFTCLRQLSREESSQRFLRCYIFPDTYDARAIKLLELDIQLGKDEKRDYDAIDKLMDIKRSVLERGEVTEEEYAQHAGMKKGEMKSALAQIALIDEFLDLMDAPGSYHIAKDLKIQDPIRSLASKLKKCKNEDEREDLKQMMFANLMLLDEGDRARDTRVMMDQFLASRKSGGEYADEQMSIVDRVFDKLEERSEDVPLTTEYIRDNLRGDEELEHELKASHAKERFRSSNKKIKEDQVAGVTDALDSLQGVDVNLLGKLSPEQLSEMLEALGEVLAAAAQLKTRVENTLEQRG